METQAVLELVGQDHVVRTLGNAIEQGELHMPIYLWGPGDGEDHFGQTVCEISKLGGWTIFGST